MAKKTRVSALEYKALKEALRRSKFGSSSVLARVLLETWAFEDGQINSDWWVREKVCEKGDFSKLRSKLVKDNWIIFRDDNKKYFPGIRLKPYLEKFEENRNATLSDLTKLNAKIDSLDELKADKKDLKEVRDDVQDIKAQMNEIREILAELHRLQAPPPSLQAQKRSADLTIRLDNLLGTKIN